MICPKCKKEIPPNSINCPHCNAKIGTICKKCNTYNFIYNKACIECGTELLKFCPECKSANFPTAKQCRKCGYDFTQNNTKNINPSKKVLNNQDSSTLIPPKQFVVPHLEQKAPKHELPKTLNLNKKKGFELPDVAKSNDDLLSPVKKFIDDSRKPIANTRRTLESKNKLKLSTNKNSVSNELQQQISMLQNQLSGLRDQLDMLPYQLGQIGVEPLEEAELKVKNDENLQQEEEKKNKPKVVKPKQQISLKDKLEQKIIEKKKHSQQKAKQKIKGILPLKQNQLPNRHNATTIPFKSLPEIKIKRKKETPKEEVKKSEINVKYAPSFFTQQSAKSVLINLILNTEVKIIGLNGKRGLGKNIVLKATMNELKDNQLVWLIGKGGPTTQNTPFGLFQDMLLSFFNLPNFCVDIEQLKKDSFSFFKQEFSSLSVSEISDLMNFLYPQNVDYYENIFKNKVRTFNLLKKVFEVISSRVKTIFVIDNLEYVDATSYEFLKLLISSEFNVNSAKFLVLFSDDKSVKNYLYAEDLKDSDYTDISLVPFNDSQTDTFIDSYNPLFATTTQSMRENIQNVSGGNPAHIEQILNLMLDTSRNYINFTLPESFEDVVRTRLNILKKENIMCYEILVACATLGLKFYPVLLNQLFKVDDRTFVDLFGSLIRLNYITPVNELAYEFKNVGLWKAILNITKNERAFLNLNKKLFAILSEFTLSSHTLLAQLALNIHQKLPALNIWSDVVKLSAYLGDVNMYVKAQQMSLVLVKNIQGANSSLIINNIHERLGKILSYSKPKVAADYLNKAIKTVVKLDDPLKMFELNAYLIDCYTKMHNYHGIVSCVNFAVDNVDDSHELEIAMLKSRKLYPLLRIGNYGEVIETIDIEVMPILEKYLDTTKPHDVISIKDLFSTWLKTYLILTEALCLQGDNRTFSIIETIFEILLKNKVSDKLYIAKLKLILALGYTLRGNTEESEKVITEVSETNPDEVLDDASIIRMNLIHILNMIFSGKFEGLQEDLFNLVAFVNNVDDKITKNILKALLGKVLKENKKYKKALAIYSEEISYFANEKNALGVLLCWYLISEVTLITEGPKKSLEFALKALDIAQSPKIQNFYFIIALNKVIARTYLVLGDLDSARIYIESAIGIARQFDMLDMLCELYMLYGRYLHEMVGTNEKTARDYAVSSFRMYDKAYNLAHKINNVVIANTVIKANAELRRDCQKRGIDL